MPRALLVLFAALLAVPSLADAPASPEVVRTVGRLTVAVDTTAAYQGGLLVVRLRSRARLGAVEAVFDGRRVPFFSTRRGPRALVGIPVDFRPGSAPLGIEVYARRGRQRFLVRVAVAARAYPGRQVTLPEARAALASAPEAVHDGRIVQLDLRTLSATQHWSGPFRAPTAIEPVPSFGAPSLFGDSLVVDALTDAVWGEYHRGLDYMVPVGTPVAAPAAGEILQAGPLTLTGQTVILDHGQGVVSILYHLGAVHVRQGDFVEAGRVVGLSGDTGVTDQPALHWGIYVDGVAVDPRVMLGLKD